MTVRGITLRVAMGILILQAPRSEGQTAADRPQFEVASLKPNNGCENHRTGGNLSPSPGRLQMGCVNLQNLIQAAYGTFADGATINTQPLRTEGAPGWAQSEYYSLEAKADGPVRTEMLAGPMLRALLEERFQLKAHREAREMPVYALTVGKSGLKVQPLAEGSCTPIDLSHPPSPPAPGQPMPKLCGAMMIGATGGNRTIEVTGVNMTQFCQRLSGQVDRAVVDKTGIAGKFTFHLEFTPDTALGGVPGRGGDAGNPGNAGNPAPPADPAGPTIFAALQEQLGLKLAPEKGPVEFLVIDHVEKPAEN
jgi:uncharacterized protein (TIGR03435 family)